MHGGMFLVALECTTFVFCQFTIETKSLLANLFTFILVFYGLLCHMTFPDNKIIDNKIIDNIEKFYKYFYLCYLFEIYMNQSVGDYFRLKNDL